MRMSWVGWDDEDQDEDDVLSNAGWLVSAPLVSGWPRLPAAERLVVARQSPASGVTLPHPPQSVSVPALARIRRSPGKSASELVTISDQHLWQLCLLCLTRRFVRQGSIQIAWFVGKIFHSEFSGFDKNHKVNGNLLLLDIWISHKEGHFAPRKAKWNKSAEPRPQHWEQSFSCYE